MAQHIKLYAIVTKDDDGSGADFSATQIQNVLNEANKIWGTAGIVFDLDPSQDLEQTNSTVLNEDKSATDHWRNSRERSRVAAQHYGRLVVFFRDYKGNPAVMLGYGFSGGGDFAVMPKDDRPYAGRLFAHEVGHYMHLKHTFGGVDLHPADPNATPDQKEQSLREQQAQLIKDYVAAGHDEAEGLDVFDGDRPLVLDTPPDDGGQLIALLNGGDSAGPIDQVEIEVDFPRGKRKYLLKPDRSNIMAYFFGAAQLSQRVSAGQSKAVRACLKNGNRRHLVTGEVSANAEETEAEIAPAAVTWGRGRLDLFARGSDGRMFNKVWEEGRWWPGELSWQDVGAPARGVAGAPSVVSWGAGRLDLFVRGSDGRIYNKVWEQSRRGWWPGQTEWADLGGMLSGGPIAVTWGPGRLDLFARGKNGHVYNKVWEQATDTWWPGQLDWADLGGSVSGSPTAVTWGPGRLDLFVRGTDGRAYNKVWEQSRRGWWPGQTDWADLGGSILGSPMAVTWGLGRLDLFVRGSDERIYNKVWEKSRSRWWPGQVDWQDIGAPPAGDMNAGGPVLTPPATSTWGPGRLDLFVSRNDGRVYNKVWETSSGTWWPGQLEWQDLGGAIVGAPVAITWAPGRLDLFARGINGAIESKVWAVRESTWWPSEESWFFLGFPG